MPLKDKIEQDLIARIKAKDEEGVSALRMLKARLQTETIAKQKDLSDEEVVSIVKSQQKRHLEASEGFKQGGNQTQAQTEENQAKILAVYLPVQLNAQEVEKLVTVAQVEHGWTSKDFGLAMKTLSAQLGGAVDGKMLAEIVKNTLNNSDK